MLAVSNDEPLTAVLELARGHRLDIHEEVVEPAGPGQPRDVRGVEHAARLCERLLRTLQGENWTYFLGLSPT